MPELYFFMALSIASFAVSALFMSMFLKVHRSPEKATVSFQLHPEATQRELTILAVVQVVKAGGLFAHGIGAYFEYMTVSDAGLGLVSVLPAFEIWVFYHWWRRF